MIHSNPLPDLHQLRKQCGQKGEAIALTHLREKGYSIIKTNVHSRYGEIDIVAMKNGIMHMCEVKTRTNVTFGTPEEAVNWKKLQKLKKTIQCYQQQFGYARWQLDVIAIYLAPSPSFRLVRLTHYKNIPLP